MTNKTLLTIQFIIAISLLCGSSSLAGEIVLEEDFSKYTVGEALPHDAGKIQAFGDYSEKDNAAVTVIEKDGMNMVHLSDEGKDWVGTKTYRVRSKSEPGVRTFSFDFIEPEGISDGDFSAVAGAWLGPGKDMATWKFSDGYVFGKERYQVGELTHVDIITNNTDAEVEADNRVLPAHTHTVFINGTPVGRPQELKMADEYPSGSTIERLFFRTYSDSKQEVLIGNVVIRDGVYVNTEKPAQSSGNLL